jgi:hypothetical protein
MLILFLVFALSAETSASKKETLEASFGYNSVQAIAAATSDSSGINAKPDRMFLEQWSCNAGRQTYFYDSAGSRETGWGLKLQRISSSTWERREAHVVSNTAIYAEDCFVKSIPGIEHWVDAWGRLHSMQVLQEQAAYNCEARQNSSRRYGSDHDKLWSRYQELYGPRELLENLTPEPAPSRVWLTGLLDKETLEIPCRRLRMRQAALKARLLVECARSQKQPCLGPSMPNAALSFLKGVIDDAGDTIISCEAGAKSVPMSQAGSLSGTNPFGASRLSGLKDIPPPPLSESDQAAFEKGRYFVFARWEDSPESFVREQADPLLWDRESFEVVRAAQKRAEGAIEKAEDAADELWGALEK